MSIWTNPKHTVISQYKLYSIKLVLQKIAREVFLVTLINAIKTMVNLVVCHLNAYIVIWREFITMAFDSP